METDFASVQASISSALVATTRSATQIANEDLVFHRSLEPVFNTSLNRQNARLLGLAERLLGASTAGAENVRLSQLRDVEAVEGNWRTIVDVIDSLLERADTALDDFTGAVRRLSPGAAVQPQQERHQPVLKQAKVSNAALALQRQNIEKPQLKFDHVPVNDETGSFKPLLLSKPHATVPLTVEAGHGTHPYRLEIEQYRYPTDTVYTQAEPIPYQPFETTTGIFVDTEEALNDMLQELKHARAIAIDLEHHDQRSYVGIVSLMQISSRDKDWIIDTLKPWRRRLQCLNEVFADPSIVKVLHGAYMDVVWLQRDLGLYLVGLFDTHYASRALGYSGGSLAFLLKRFVGIDAQKQYQMADWRIRPLPQELLDYARSDTHYLLYIFDCMRNELVERSDFSKPNGEGDKIWEVLQKSKEVALQRYEHPVYDTELGQGPMGWYKLLARTPAFLSREQFSIFKAVHKWRDAVAREQDDSVHYVMPSHQIFTIAKAMPGTTAEMFGVTQPATQTIRLRADELVNVIVKAKDAGKLGPEMMEVLNKIEPHLTRKAFRDEASHSVAPIVPRTADGMNVVDKIATSVLPIRCSISTFWGSTLSRIEPRGRDFSTATNVSLLVPLPPLTADILTKTAESAASQSRAERYLPSSQKLTTAHVDGDALLPKGKAKKRKLVEPAEPDSVATQTDEVAVPDSELDTLRKRFERKKAKKEAKHAARLPTGNAPNDQDATKYSDGEVPFDYNAAPSILNPPRESRQILEEKRKREKNPYAKAMDAPKGLPRVQKEKSGRTLTYLPPK